MLSGSDVARIFGVSATTVKNWRDGGFLVPIYKTPTGRYMYSEEQVNIFKQSMMDSTIEN